MMTSANEKKIDVAKDTTTATLTVGRQAHAVPRYCQMLGNPCGLAIGPQVRHCSFSVAVDGADQKVDAPLVDKTPLGFDPLSVAL